jgi:hypothetical protein
LRNNALDHLVPMEMKVDGLANGPSHVALAGVFMMAGSRRRNYHLEDLLDLSASSFLPACTYVQRGSKFCFVVVVVVVVVVLLVLGDTLIKLRACIQFGILPLQYITAECIHAVWYPATAVWYPATAVWYPAIGVILRVWF